MGAEGSLPGPSYSAVVFEHLPQPAGNWCMRTEEEGVKVQEWEAWGQAPTLCVLGWWWRGRPYVGAVRLQVRVFMVQASGQEIG